MAQSVMSFMGIYACLSTVMFGSGFLICVCNYSFQIELIAQDFKDLDELWRHPETSTVKYRHAYLCNICMKLQDIKRYVENHIKCAHIVFNFVVLKQDLAICSSWLSLISNKLFGCVTNQIKALRFALDDRLRSWAGSELHELRN